jgi:hypothetical protein
MNSTTPPPTTRGPNGPPNPPKLTPAQIRTQITQITQNNRPRDIVSSVASHVCSNNRHHDQDRDDDQEDDDCFARTSIHDCSPHELIPDDFPIVTVLKFLFVNNINDGVELSC